MWFIWMSFLLPYYGMSLLFWFVDKYTVFCYKRYKYSDYTSILNQYSLVIKQVLFNTLCLFPLLTYISFHLKDIDYGDLSVPRCISSLIIYTLAYEICFYYSHLLFHTRYLYNTIHYQHHQLIVSIAFGGVYSHPIEFIFGNYIPATIGIFLLPSPHYYTILIWNVIAATGVTLSHAGYFGTHIRHHVYTKYNFGTLGLMDYFSNTQDKNID